MRFIVLLLASQTLRATPPWQWPMDPSHGLTASFGEYRGTRFHMGLDFSTAGREGMLIRPAREGTVFRLRANATGYGRVAYVEHGEGHVTVYAHMAAFGPTLCQAIQSLGHDPQKYFGTLDLNVPVSSGDILGYSGESGSGLPHFHFEVRNGLDLAINPLDLPFPPLNTDHRVVVEGLRLIPLDAQSRVQGLPVPVSFSGIPRRIHAKGKVGIQIQTYLADQNGNRLGLPGIRLQFGDQPLGQWQPVQISYDRHNRAMIVFDPSRSGFSPTHYTYRFDHNPPFSSPLKPYASPEILDIRMPGTLSLSLLDLSEQWHTFPVEIDTSDVAPKAPPSSPDCVQPTTLTAIPWRDTVTFWAHTSGKLRWSGQDGDLASGAFLCEQVQPGGTGASLEWITAEGSVHRNLGCLQGGRQLNLEDWTLQATNGTPKQAVLLLPPRETSGGGTFRFLGSVLCFGLDGKDAAQAVISFTPQTPLPPHTCLLLWSHATRRWSWVACARESQPMQVKLDYWAPLVVAQDLKPPTISGFKSHRFFQGNRWIIPVNDRGTGIDADSVMVHTQDKTEYEYDPDRRWIIFEQAPAGSVTVNLRDRAGQSAQATLDPPS